MAGYTTTITNAAKLALMSAIHCLFAPVTKTGVSGVNGAYTLTGLTDTSGIAVGMSAAGSAVAAGAVVASVDSGTQVTVSKPHTGTITSQAITFTGDVIKAVLLKPSPTGTYDKTTTAYSDITGNSDEVSGTGYTAGGLALTNNAPALSTDTAVADFVDASWTSATLSARALALVNTTRRGATDKPVISIHDFGGTQTVTSGTFSVIWPTPDASNGIIRLS